MTTEATCERCDGRGWNLRDARIDVCGCGAFDTVATATDTTGGAW